MSDVNRDPIGWERSMTQDKDGQYVSYHDYAVLLDSHDRLRAELAEARRLLDEARKQEPVATHDEIEFSRYCIEWTKGPLPIGTKLYAAPVPAHPAVPDDVAKDADQNALRLALVWRVATCRETDEERAALSAFSPDATYGEFIAGIDAAILSATKTEGRKDESA